jgi:hypothetical protein
MTYSYKTYSAEVFESQLVHRLTSEHPLYGVHKYCGCPDFLPGSVAGVGHMLRQGGAGALPCHDFLLGAQARPPGACPVHSLTCRDSRRRAERCDRPEMAVTRLRPSHSSCNPSSASKPSTCTQSLSVRGSEHSFTFKNYGAIQGRAYHCRCRQLAGQSGTELRL